jgi:hypothetical protein
MIGSIGSIGSDVSVGSIVSDPPRGEGGRPLDPILAAALAKPRFGRLGECNRRPRPGRAAQRAARERLGPTLDRLLNG